ncbi:MAG: prepilin peptidase [Parafannyhessea sp.]|uniref:prepilin peptidase n=1 Tax=Parafannyhessea sp. TaxID=2847324 RepID=UPI003EFE0872
MGWLALRGMWAIVAMAAAVGAGVGAASVRAAGAWGAGGGGGVASVRPGVASCFAGALAGALVLGVEAWSLAGAGGGAWAAPGEAASALALCCCLVWASVFDLAWMRIPNGCLAVAAAVRVACLMWDGALGGAGLGPAVLGAMGCLLVAVGVACVATAFSLTAARMLGEGCVGAGDVKLVAVASMYLGPAQMTLMLALACALGVGLALVWRRWVRVPLGLRRVWKAQAGARTPGGGDVRVPFRGDVFPWGPALGVGCWIALALGEAGAGQLLGLL